MEGVFATVVRGRSPKRDAGFLGRLALGMVEGIDGAHAMPLSDADVLLLVTAELEVGGLCTCGVGCGVFSWFVSFCVVFVWVRFLFGLVWFDLL